MKQRTDYKYLIESRPDFVIPRPNPIIKIGVETTDFQACLEKAKNSIPQKKRYFHFEKVKVNNVPAICIGAFGLVFHMHIGIRVHRDRWRK